MRNSREISATHNPPSREDTMRARMRSLGHVAPIPIAATICLMLCMPGAAFPQQFHEDWESGQWGDWELTGTQQTPPSGWSFEEGYNSTYSAQAKHYHSFGGWGGWTGLLHSIDIPATVLDLFYYFDSSGHLDYAFERVVLYFSDDRKVEYWLDTYDYEIPQSTEEIKYIDCTGASPATWTNLHRNIPEDIAGFSTGQVTAFEYGANSRGNGDGAFYALMRADNIMLQAAPDTIPPEVELLSCLLYTSPSPRDVEESRMPSSA